MCPFVLENKTLFLWLKTNYDINCNLRFYSTSFAARKKIPQFMGRPPTNDTTSIGNQLRKHLGKNLALILTLKTSTA
jgi:hypothetical protein